MPRPLVAPRLTLLCLSAMLLASPAAAQVLLFDNGEFITGIGTGVNDGAPVSQAESGVISIGFNENATVAQGGPIRVTDDFDVAGAPPGGARLSRLHFHGVQTNAITTDVQFGALYVAIYDGTPHAGGSLIAGDSTTNRLLSSTWTGAYRLSSSGTPSTSRPITLLEADMSWAPPLADGTYWLLVSAVGDAALSATPNPQTIFVTPHPIDANAQQFFNGTWFAIWDLPFTLYSLCPVDFDASGEATVADIFVMLGAWFAGEARADWNRSGASDIPDIFLYLTDWFGGCP